MGAVDWCPLLSGGFLHGAKISRTVCSHLSSSFQFSRLQKYSNHQIVSFLERIGAEFGACQVRLWRSGGGVGGLPGAHRGGVQGVPGAHRGGFWGVTGASGWSLGRDRCAQL